MFPQKLTRFVQTITKQVVTAFSYLWTPHTWRRRLALLGFL